MTRTTDGIPDSYRMVHLAETDSTNAEAMRRALAGEAGPLWVRADQQTAGRGRSGRSWVSLAGNLHASLVISTNCPVAQVGQLSLVAGVAAFDAINAASRLNSNETLRLKWPNDILVGTAKAGGILIESSVCRAGAGMTAVVGVGLNLEVPPEGLGAAATNLAAHGLSLSPGEALCFLAQAMDAWLKTWNDGQGFALVREAWLARTGAPGERLTVYAGDVRVEGRFKGLDEDGALVIAENGGGERRVTFGDVRLASEPDEAHTQERDERA